MPDEKDDKTAPFKVIEYSEDFIDVSHNLPLYEVWGTHTLKSAGDAAKLPGGKKPPEAFNNTRIKANAMVKSEKAWAAYDGLTFLGVCASGAKAYNGIIAIAKVWGKEEESIEVKQLTTLSEGSYALEGVLKTIKGVKELANKNPQLIGNLGKGLEKGASVFKIGGGGFLVALSITELSGKQKDNDRAASVCGLFQEL